MLGGADNPNGELPSYITGADIDLCDSDNDVLPGLPDAFQRKDARRHPMRTIWNRARIRIKRLISIRHLRQAEIYV